MALREADALNMATQMCAGREAGGPTPVSEISPTGAFCVGGKTGDDGKQFGH